MNSIQFMPDTFMLRGDTARTLYASVRELPIFDYHCHLDPKEIWQNRAAASLGELWLAADHYKWRLMRAAGIDEFYITGGASYDEKLLAFAAVLPKAAGNPVCHWVRMELAAYFGITTPLNAETAPEILAQANAMLAAGGFTPQELITRSNVRAIYTTDDPADTLEFHRRLRDTVKGVEIAPTFRPDMAVDGLTRPRFAGYAAALCGEKPTFDQWLKALHERVSYFAAQGCRITDISLPDIPPPVGSRAKAAAAFDTVMDGGSVSAEEVLSYQDFMLRTLALAYADQGLVMQLHLSALRNNNTALFRAAGVDSGNDSIGDGVTIRNLCAFCDDLARVNRLPRTIVYTLHSGSWAGIATMLGNFAGDSPGKLQLGAAWWHHDHVDGITEQLSVCAATGLLGYFNGMLTDSRSFTSYPRHDYFRRILCNLLASWVDEGLFDAGDAATLAADVCYHNAKRYFTNTP